MADFFLSILSNGVYDLLKNTIISSKEHAIRLCHYETYQRDVKILTERLDILKKYQKEVITMVESAKQKDKDVYPNVLEWIEKTENDLSEYREKVKSSSQNFSHFVVHPQAMIDVDSLSKSINESIKHCVEFRDCISYYSCHYDKDYMSFGTRRRALEGVMEALKDPNVKMIGLHGMGGIGKTTLAKKIARQVKKEANLFDKHIDLSKIGIHFSDDQTGCKILFTSRRQGLYSHAVEFAIDSLQEDESTKLFRKVVDITLDENPECLSELVKECGGLPIVINVVAAALKDAPSSKWRTFLNEMRNSAPENIEGMTSKVFWSIKLSYNFLESEEAKSLLLLCSIFPEDRFISDYELVIYSVGWRSFQNVNTMGDAKDKLSTLIDTLRKHCLLLPSDKSESHIRYHWVKLHDVIRDVLKSVAKEEGLFSLSKYEELPEEKHANLAVVSLLPDFETQLPDILACPNLVSFIDMSFDEKRLSDCFFAETKKLRVLKLKNVDLRSPPSSFSCLLESLEILCLTYCDLEDTTFLGSFKKLKCLDLLRCRFKTLSKQVGQLTHLQSLTIGSCKYLEVIEPDVISSLINLEELYMRHVKIAWEVEKVSSERSNVSLAELKNLTRLNTLYLEIQNDTYLSKDFISRNIKSYQITVGEPDSLFADNFSSYSRVLMLELHNGNLIKECGFDKLMKECQALQLRGCEDVPIDIDVSNADGFPELEVFDLRDASNVRYLMECNHPVFQNLKKLQLTRLSNLQKMYDGELVAGSFSKLKEVQVSECHTLKSLFPVSTIAGQLEEMEVESCDMMENIVFHKNENGTHQKIEFLKLQKLVLKRLPKLIQFCKLEPEQNVTTSPSLDSSPSTSIFPLFREEVVAFPILEQLHLSWLDCVEMIWPDQVQEVSYMQNLKNINVEKCHELKYLFSSVVARSLAQLKALKVEECKNMQEIIVIKEAGNEEGSSMETICFPKLWQLHLYSLSNVKTFSGGNYLAIECPSLKILYISECPKLKTFHKNCSNEIEAAEEPLFNEKVVSFPILEKLELSSLGSVEMIWPHKLQEVSHMQNLKDLQVSYCNKLKYLFSSAVARSFIQLKSLHVGYCENMEEIVVIKEEGSSNDTISFPKLHHIVLDGLRNLKRFSRGKPLAVECEGLMKRSCRNEFEEAKLQPFFNQKISFPMLEKLELSSLDSVEMIWADELEEVSYMQNLKDLNVDYCGKLKYVFPCAMERRLALETLYIERCPNLEMMKSWTSTEIVEGEDHTFTENKVVVPNLEEVSLKWMFMPSSMSFQNLREIRIFEHNEMINLMNSSTARSLAQLQHLTISKCKEMRQVIVDEEEAGENVMVFLKLKTLMLHDLPNLKSFNCGNSDIQFPNLKKVVVSECPHMENFSSGNVITYKLAKIITKLRFEFIFDLMNDEGIEEVWKGDLKTSVRMIWEENKQLGFDGLDLE
ncbi:hypothetical protein CsatB_013729 [Cannabis sativa]